MEEHLQARPYLLQMLLAGEFHHAYQYAEHPARHTRDIGYVVQRFMGDAVALHLNAEQCGFLLGTRTMLASGLILHEDGTQVTHHLPETSELGEWLPPRIRLLPSKHGLRVVAQIVSHSIESPL